MFLLVLCSDGSGSPGGLLVDPSLPYWQQGPDFNSTNRLLLTGGWFSRDFAVESEKKLVSTHFGKK